MSVRIRTTALSVLFAGAIGLPRAYAQNEVRVIDVQWPSPACVSDGGSVHCSTSSPEFTTQTSTKDFGPAIGIVQLVDQFYGQVFLNKPGAGFLRCQVLQGPLAFECTATAAGQATGKLRYVLRLLPTGNCVPGTCPIELVIDGFVHTNLIKDTPGSGSASSAITVSLWGADGTLAGSQTLSSTTLQGGTIVPVVLTCSVTTGDIAYLDLEAAAQVVKTPSALWETSAGTILRASVAGDRDGDGLLDSWETSGIDVNSDGIVDLDLPARGANPDHKDLFVEIDAMVGRAPSIAAIDLVVDAFSKAPASLVSNPGGAHGVTLHYCLDELNVPVAAWPAVDANGWPLAFDTLKANQSPSVSGGFGTVAERSSSNWPNIRDAKRLAYRYCVFADQFHGKSYSGMSELPGNDFFVTLGHPNWPTAGGTVFEQAGTFMHELGHALGLRHGGADDVRFKPNYHSVMNYTWQLPGGINNRYWSLVYSAEPFFSLDEASLDEAVGVGGPSLHKRHATVVGPLDATSGEGTLAMEHGPRDWDGNGSKNDIGVKRDLNYLDNQVAPSPGDKLIIGAHLDWSALKYDFRKSADFADGAHGTSSNLTEITATEFVEQLGACPHWTTYCTTKKNSVDCVPMIALSGSTSFTGPDDLRVDVTNVRSQRYGVLAWSRDADEMSFLGGTLCLAQPLLRGPVEHSGGNQSNDCSGSYSFALTQAYLAAEGLVPGDLMYCQVWSRDWSTFNPSGVSLTEGIVFAVCP